MYTYFIYYTYWYTNHNKLIQIIRISQTYLYISYIISHFKYCMDKLVHIHTSYNIPLSLIIKQSFTVLHQRRAYNIIHFEWIIYLLYNIQAVSCPIFTLTCFCRSLLCITIHKVIPHLRTYQLLSTSSFVSQHTKSYPVFTPTSSRLPLPSYHTHKVIPYLRTYRLLPAPSFISHTQSYTPSSHLPAPAGPIFRIT